MQKKRIVLIGFMGQIDMSCLSKDVRNFFEMLPCEAIPFVPTFHELTETAEKFPDSYLVYCPTAIPKKINAQLRQGCASAILAKHNVVIGYLKTKNHKITQISLCYNGKGTLNRDFLPRKRKESPLKRNPGLTY